MYLNVSRSRTASEIFLEELWLVVMRGEDRSTAEPRGRSPVRCDRSAVLYGGESVTRQGGEGRGGDGVGAGGGG
jgi:hypothetical protein